MFELGSSSKMFVLLPSRTGATRGLLLSASVGAGLLVVVVLGFWFAGFIAVLFLVFEAGAYTLVSVVVVVLTMLDFFDLKGLEEKLNLN